MFATNTDLHAIAPDAFEQGVDDWTDEIALAETDVINYVRVQYWNNHNKRSDFDSTLLTPSQWSKATVYRALANYILPKMATFRIDDVFLEQIKFYKERYSEEMDLQFALGIEYDADNNDVIDDTEVETYKQDRLYR